MPKDKRLYMTFPIDMHRHPKVSRLPVSVRWTFFEMNGEARIADNDGVFTQAEAEYLWPIKHLEALVTSHPERPLLVRAGGSYIIRDYAEHQQTKAERDERAATNRENGRLGGRPPKNPLETESKPTGLLNKATGTQTKPESESESKSKLEIPLDVTTDLESSHLPNREAEGRDRKARVAAEGLGITDLVRVTETFVRVTKQPLTLGGSVELARAILSKAAGEVTKVDAYLASVCRKTPDEVAQAYFDLDLGAVA